MIPITKQARDKREGLKDAHTKQLYEEPKASLFAVETGDIITVSGEPHDEVHLPKVDF